MFAKQLFSLLVLILVLVLDVWSQNVLISDSNGPAEPTIMMDHNRPNVVMAATNLNSYYRSTDTGRTWTEHRLTSSYGVWGDPVLVVDNQGHFFYTHLSNPANGHWIDRIVCQRSEDDGATWNDGSFPDTSGITQHDKQWMAIDHQNNLYMTWTRFDDYGSTDPQDSSVILFSRSEDQGETWSKPLRINRVAGDCIDDDNTVEGAVPAVGPNGELYVSWAGPTGLRFNRSYDGGNTWWTDDTLIDPMPGGWNYEVPGLFRCNGLPVTACDRSFGAHHGTIYVNWTDQRNGSDDTDVWLAKSTDGGLHWTAPKKVNTSNPHTHQFLTWMAIDQSDGSLWFVYYSREDSVDIGTDVMLTYSLDGGETFVQQKISDSAFYPNPTVFFGDYTNITTHNGIVRPIWSRMDNARLSVWTDVTPRQVLMAEDREEEVIQAPFELQQNYPNPAAAKTYVSFKLRGTATVSLILYNRYGQQVGNPIDEEVLEYGKHLIPIERKTWDLTPGIYYYQLTVNGESKTKKMLLSESE